MKTLRKLLLINWHFFVHETIELKRLNFLTGMRLECFRTLARLLKHLDLHNHEVKIMRDRTNAPIFVHQS